MVSYLARHSSLPTAACHRATAAPLVWLAPKRRPQQYTRQYTAPRSRRYATSSTYLTAPGEVLYELLAPPPPDGEEQGLALYSISGRPRFQELTLSTGSKSDITTVYQANEVKTGGRAIIKAFHKDKMQPKHHQKLQREIDAMVKLNGPFVVELQSTFSDEGHIYLVLEYCEGGDLFKMMIKEGGRLDEHYVCVEIILPLLRALEKMHALSIMHRDIKPENIFLTREGCLRLGDFGLAIDWSKEIPFSRSGTLDYMAPEVLQNPVTKLQESPTVDLATLTAQNIKPFTCAVDVWAAGVLAYELVCGHPPFEVEDEVKTQTNILSNNAIKFPTPTATGFTVQWADFVRSALNKDPLQRPDATTLLQHPWIQNNLQRAIASAPTPEHRQSKEDLLRPLSLTPRPMRLPSLIPPTPDLAPPQPDPASPAATEAPVLSAPLEEPERAAPDAPQGVQVGQFTHPIFSSGMTSCGSWEDQGGVTQGVPCMDSHDAVAYAAAAPAPVPEPESQPAAVPAAVPEAVPSVEMSPASGGASTQGFFESVTESSSSKSVEMSPAGGGASTQGFFEPATESNSSKSVEMSPAGGEASTQGFFEPVTESSSSKSVEMSPAGSGGVHAGLL